MKTKTILLYISAFVLLIFISEALNYFADPHSRVSSILNRYFINKSVFYSKENNYDKAIYYLLMASKANIYGEYGVKFSQIPRFDGGEIDLQGDEKFKETFTLYMSSLTDNDLKLPEDQGLGRIFYTLALMASGSENLKLSEQLLKLAMYNNPRFASFHAELINYYFRSGAMNKVDQEMNYCFRFTEAKTLCEMYKGDSLLKNIPKDIGYMQKEVERHYLNK